MSISSHISSLSYATSYDFGQVYSPKNRRVSGFMAVCQFCEGYGWKGESLYQYNADVKSNVCSRKHE